MITFISMWNYTELRNNFFTNVAVIVLNKVQEAFYSRIIIGTAVSTVELRGLIKTSSIGTIVSVKELGELAGTFCKAQLCPLRS